MRRWPPPLSVTRPPPSSTTSGPWSLRTLAVAFMAIVTGDGPQSKVITPPAASAVATAAAVQPAGGPVPRTRSGLRVAAALASAGTEAAASGLPGLGSDRGRCEGLGAVLELGRELGLGPRVATVDADVETVGAVGAGATK